jgi:prepilin-type N-terminal cleavage/methylation domain-containing protein
MSGLRHQGFTMVELLVTIGIMGLLIALSTSVDGTFSKHEGLEIATVSLVESVRHAQLNSQNGKGDSSWGVRVFENKAVVFMGSSYASRNTTYDQAVGLPGGVKASGLGEIVFAEFTGGTLNSGVVVLSNDFGKRNILINAKGTVSY